MKYRGNVFIIYTLIVVYRVLGLLVSHFCESKI